MESELLLFCLQTLQVLILLHSATAQAQGVLQELHALRMEKLHAAIDFLGGELHSGVDWFSIADSLV